MDRRAGTADDLDCALDFVVPMTFGFRKLTADIGDDGIDRIASLGRRWIWTGDRGRR
jgi:hypothetical protein